MKRPNPQEIQDAEGYVILASMSPGIVGEVREIAHEGDLAPVGTKLRVIGTVTVGEARRYAKRWNIPGDVDIWEHFIKVVAE